MNHNLVRIYLIVLVFSAAIIFPLVNSKVHLLNDIESFENRAMKREPDFDINHLDPFPVKYDTFYTDNFDLRNRYIRYFNIYKVLAFRKSPIRNIVIGGNSWLYLLGDEMDSYMGKNRLTAAELESIGKELNYRKNYLEEKGIKFYFMVVPCKASIHSEHIGYEYFRMHEDTWGEQLINYLDKNSLVNSINVYDSLRKFKGDENLYFKLDNHWNDLGAFYTANEVFKHMRAEFPSIELLSVNDFNKIPPNNPKGNLDKMLGNLGVFNESYIELSPKNGYKATEGAKANYPPTHGFVYPWDFEKVREIKDSKKPKLLIISDSFGGSIFPFLAENFSKSVKIFDSWQYKLNEEIVDQEKPNVVLLMINEPILRELLKFQSRPNANKIQ
ncbi:DHHW family protein [Aurantibacillus circumpalustris]|uniref:DHHW family protein n=1 Tax=Aurantibacillus circumpalustris TaxID=3036359 RepID=UPI00295AC849|nr:DHHW family protein [Aurantibacillus circumpalustris]